jgi:hypothetical protein
MTRTLAGPGARVVRGNADIAIEFARMREFGGYSTSASG